MAGALLAIDHGTKHTGFAVTDALRIAMEPLEPYYGAGDGSEALDHVARLLDDRVVEGFVLGLPLNMDGTDGPRAAEVRAFARKLSERFPGLAVHWQDERLSSREADEVMRDAGVPRARRRELQDSYAAWVILRDWVRAEESRRRGASGPNGA